MDDPPNLLEDPLYNTVEMLRRRWRRGRDDRRALPHNRRRVGHHADNAAGIRSRITGGVEDILCLLNGYTSADTNQQLPLLCLFDARFRENLRKHVRFTA